MRAEPSRICSFLGFLIVSSTLAGSVEAGVPLHEAIDRAIEAKLEGRVAPLATDAEFLRRISLDLTGMIPTAGEARAFLDDPSPYKRERLIDRLLDECRICAADANVLRRDADGASD